MLAETSDAVDFEFAAGQVLRILEASMHRSSQGRGVFGRFESGGEPLSLSRTSSDTKGDAISAEVRQYDGSLKFSTTFDPFGE